MRCDTRWKEDNQSSFLHRSSSFTISCHEKRAPNRAVRYQTVIMTALLGAKATVVANCSIQASWEGVILPECVIFVKLDNKHNCMAQDLFGE